MTSSGLAVLGIAAAFGLGLLAACGRRPPTSPTGVGFRDAAAETGLRFQHFTGATGQFYLPEIMGSGVALLDYDGDGNLISIEVLDASVRVSDARKIEYQTTG